MASACFETSTLWSQPDFAVKPSFFSRSSIFSLRSFHHFSLSFTRCSSRFFPVRYFSMIAANFITRSRSTGLSGPLTVPVPFIFFSSMRSPSLFSRSCHCEPARISPLRRFANRPPVPYKPRPSPQGPTPSAARRFPFLLCGSEFHLSMSSGSLSRSGAGFSRIGATGLAMHI